MKIDCCVLVFPYLNAYKINKFYFKGIPLNMNEVIQLHRECVTERHRTEVAGEVMF